MAAVFTSLMRGLVGIAATVLVVAVIWTVYVKREAVRAVGETVIGLVMPATGPLHASPPPARPSGLPAPAPASASGTEGPESVPPAAQGTNR